MRSSPLWALLLVLFAAACAEPRRIVNDPNWVPPSDVRVEAGKIVIDEHIHFETDSDVIQPRSGSILDHLADTILHHPEIDALKIVGHTDTQGDDLHNQDLSERRAGSVARALRDRGVQIPLAPSGEGERQPLCQETTPACHAQNRRVEFLIVEG
tara:strand:- start:5498 stop:5962 length:465 start_codon:yes stop_codon:yes gene_type:complete